MDGLNTLIVGVNRAMALGVWGLRRLAYLPSNTSKRLVVKLWLPSCLGTMLALGTSLASEPSPQEIALDYGHAGPTVAGASRLAISQDGDQPGCSTGLSQVFWLFLLIKCSHAVNGGRRANDKR